MKNVILYGLIFSVLFNIFQYVNSTKILDAKDQEVTKIKERLKKGLTEENEFITSLKRENAILTYIKENYL